MFRPIFAGVFLCLSVIAGAQIPTQGLLAYYPFCGNANDVSGNGNHLTVSNATLTTDRFSYPSAAYSFNGVNSVLYNNSVFSLGSEYTFSCWMIANSIQDGVVVYNGNSNSSGVGIVYDDGAAIPGTKATMLAGGVCFCMAKPASLSQWHHIVLRKDLTKFKLFIDNVLVDSALSNINPSVGKFHLGMDYTDGTNPFDGKIDEVAIYSRALSLTEIAQLFNYQCGTNPISSIPPNASAAVNSSASFSVGALASVSSYQWQVNSGSGFVNLTNATPYSGVNTNTLNINPVALGLTGYNYRCIVTDMSCCVDTSSISILSVTAPQNCATIQNLPDTLSLCTNTTTQLNPILNFSGPFIPFDTTWTPSAGLSNPNILNPILTVGAVSQSYKLTILALSPNNLVLNGDFNNGNTGFTSSYSLGAGGMWGPCSNPATYGVTNNPVNMHSLWAQFGDHTTGSGQMLTVNGSQAPNANVWCQSINVTANTLYDFSTWIASVDPTSPAILQFAINGVPLGPNFNASAATGQWAQFHNTWFSGSSTTANICITNQNTAFVGNDFALDDIEFREACSSTDSVYVNAISEYNQFLSATLCQGDTMSFASHLITAAGIYTGKFTSSAGCDSNVTLTVNITQPISVSQAVTLCEGGTLVFGGQVISAAGIYSHTFTAIGGCDSIVNLTVTVAPPIMVGSAASICQGGSIQFGNQIIKSAGVYSHTFTSVKGCDSIVNLTVSVNPPLRSSASVSICKDSTFTFGNQTIGSAGLYTTTFKTAEGCDSNVTLTVSVSDPPGVDFSADPAVLNEPTSFSNSSINAAVYFWDFGDSTFSTEKNPTHQYQRSGKYYVCLTGWSMQGCKDTKCRNVDAEIRAIIDVPSAFSPNGDGINDILYVRGGGIKTFTLKIFNRWGQKVFETSDMKVGWDGRFNGRLQNLESFAYVIEAIMFTGEAIQKQGNITLL